jgi:large subunit ribosomal protein L22
MKGYSMELDAETSAHARGKDLRVSFKHSIEVCKAIRGMAVEDAKKYLEEVMAKKTPVHFRKHKGHIAHRKGAGFGPGKYPVNAAKAILAIIHDVENNAEYKGLDPENMFIAHVSAYRGRVFQGWRARARGRSTAWNTVTTNIELIIQERKE